MRNSFGKTSHLYLKATLKNEQTILEDVSFTAPFKIMHPFYSYQEPQTYHHLPELKDCMTIMCLTASAGIMAGDKQHYEIIVENGAKLEFVSQSYEKIHKMEEGSAQRSARLYVAPHGLLYYNPQPSLPFKDSAFSSTQCIHLEDHTSQLIYKEILSAGRCARGEQFEYRYYHNRIHIYEGSQIIYADHTKLEPSLMPLNSLGFFEGYTHLGTLLIFHLYKNAQWMSSVRNCIENDPHIAGGISQNEHGFIIRLLGKQSEQIACIMDKILEL